MSVPSRVCLIQDLTAASGKVRVLGTILGYNVTTAMVTLELHSHCVSVDISGLLMSRQEGQRLDLKIVIGTSVHVMGYVEEDASSQELVIRAIMLWNAGNLTEKDKIAYADAIKKRNEQKQRK